MTANIVIHCGGYTLIILVKTVSNNFMCYYVSSLFPMILYFLFHSPLTLLSHVLSVPDTPFRALEWVTHSCSGYLRAGDYG